MRTSKFFYFTIQGDNFDTNEAKKIKIEGKIFQKNEVFTKHYASNVVIQKTNRWVYRDELIDGSRVSGFLTKNLKILVNNLNDLKPFINQYDTKIELTVYSENKTDICLTKTQINLLNKIGTKFYISFC